MRTEAGGGEGPRGDALAGTPSADVDRDRHGEQHQRRQADHLCR
jgi:hypothetical protein